MDLKETYLFQGLPKDEMEQLEKSCTINSYQKNMLVIRMGEESTSLYIILEGKVRIFRGDAEGKELTVATLGPGDCFGELAALVETPRSANVETLTSCKLGAVAKADFLECMSHNPDIALRIISLLIDRLHATTDDVSSIALLDVYGRVVRVLEKHAMEEDGKRIMEGFSHRDIATMIGSSREMVSRIFRDLRAGGYVSTHGSTIVIEKKLPEAW